MRARVTSAIAALGLVALAHAACEDAPASPAPGLDDFALTEPRALPPLEPVPLARARFALHARDVRYAHAGVDARVERLETTLTTEGPSSADLFGVVATGTGAEGRWRIASDAFRLRDLVLAGEAAGVRLLPTQLALDLPGRDRARATLGATVRRNAYGSASLIADVALGASAFTLAAELRDADDWTLRARLDPLTLADAHAFLDAVPAHGVARGSLLLQRRGDALHASTERLVLATDSSRIQASGGVSRVGERWSVRDLALSLEPVHARDWRAWLGSNAPIDAPMFGELHVEGDGSAGLALDGWMRAENDSMRLAGDVDGTLWLEPSLRADIRVAATGLRHPRLAALPDSVVSLLADGALTIDATLDPAAGRALGTIVLADSAGRVWLTLEGAVPLDSAGALDAIATADSLPLALLPLPERLRPLGGYARMRAHARGTLDSPRLEGDVEVIGLRRLELPEYGTSVDSIRLRLRLGEERVELADVRAFHGDGSLQLAGGLQLDGPLDLREPVRAFEGARVDIAAHLDTMMLVDMDSARAVVAGDFTVTGPLERPHVAGDLAVIDGFVYEGKLAPKPPLDPADPPYGSLVACVPWPAGRLTAAQGRNDGSDAALPLTADLTLTVGSDFRIIDEDSDLGAAGTVAVVVDEHGAFARGDARILDGFYAYYGELFQLVGGAFSVEGTMTGLAMSGVLRHADRPLGVGQGGYVGLDRRDPPLGIFGYSTRATVLELLRRRAPLPATQAELASLLLFDVPLQPVDAFDHELFWRGDEPGDLLGQRAAIQGAGLAWSYFADELYDWIPLERGYLRAGTIRVGSQHPGWIMLGTHLDAGAHVGPRLTARATYVVGGGTWPGVGLRYALRGESLQPADRHLELFNEPRFATTSGVGARDDIDARRRTGVRVRWLWDY